MTNWEVQQWITDTELHSIETSRYWNDEHADFYKPWNIIDGDFAKLERHLETTGLAKDLAACLDVLYNEFNRELAGVGIDLAAGCFWAAPYLLKSAAVRKLIALEISRHRLLKLGPALLQHYQVNAENIILALGSFYNLHVDDMSIDFVFMSSAFHHAARPDQLLGEIRRVLKRTGAVILIGEQIVDVRKERIKHAFKFVFSKLIPDSVQLRVFGKIWSAHSLIKSDAEIFQSDPILGDQLYTDDEYSAMFLRNGFTFRGIKNRLSLYQSFVLIPT